MSNMSAGDPAGEKTCQFCGLATCDPCLGPNSATYCKHMPAARPTEPEPVIPSPPVPSQSSTERKGWRTVSTRETRAAALDACSDDHLIGRYQALARLTTSPRFNRPQMAIIEGDAHEVREALERRGMKFLKPGTDEELPRVR